MSIRIKTFLFFALLSYFPALAQVDTAWVRRYDGIPNGYDEAVDIKVDKYGSVYVTGLCCWDSTTTPEFATVKYATNGDIQWIRRFDMPGESNDGASALTLDDSGNVCVTGTSNGGETYYDYTTIRYTTDGDTQWVRRYNGPPGNDSDKPCALAIDKSGNIYVTGFSWGGTSWDYATVKYSSDGGFLWVSRYDGPAHNYDAATKLVVDKSGNIFVTGYSWGSGTDYDYLTIKYNQNGDTCWTRRYSGSANREDYPKDLAVDDSGNVYVTGSSAENGIGADFTTVKYGPDGNVLWLRHYHGPTIDDAAFALAVDVNSNVYVTGLSVGFGSSSDYLTIKYNSVGDTLWTRRYNASKGSTDVPSDIQIGTSGSIYITGLSENSVTSIDYLTIKYSSDGDIEWETRYNGPGNGEDRAVALALDENENVYVTGKSSSGTSLDYTTIKYVHVSCIVKPGDADGDSTIQISDIITTINYLFKGQPALNPPCRGDVNVDGKVLLSDIVYLINFLFKSGPAPVKSRECCL